ncbi:fumarate hydratase [Streptomyces odontomachi]|uniref:fumarate hydratase n=1 Tax=Streptomyces odontomachi TaxID=2944940 RepID=UPI00210B62CF|nr:fumarate hydratase [Streptomyces sp. ODS25]
MITEVVEKFYTVLQDVAREAYVMSLKDIPPDVRRALKAAIERESEPRAAQIMRTMLDAAELGDKNMMVCQDTGIPIYWLRIGTGAHVDGARIKQEIEAGTRRATLETPFRSSIVHPITRKNRQDSTGEDIPVLHMDFTAGADYLDLLMMPKGSGSENWSFLKMLLPADGEPGIRDFILRCVADAGGKACPPLVVGVGLGGSSDQCVALAKEATARPVGQRHPDPKVAAFEEDMLARINKLGIGPQGLGGDTTALDVHIERAWTHNSMNPVAVNMQCWRGERRAARIHYDDLHVDWSYSW